MYLKFSIWTILLAISFSTFAQEKFDPTTYIGPGSEGAVRLEAAGIKTGADFSSLDLLKEDGTAFKLETSKAGYTILIMGCLT